MLNFPVKVFLDTNVFDSLHFDFNGVRFQSLKRQISDGLVELYLSDIVIGETKRHIVRNLTGIRNALRTPFRTELTKITYSKDPKINSCYETRFTGEQALRILKSSENHSFLFRLMDKTLIDSMIREALLLFDVFLNETNATVVSSKGIDVSEIIFDYFAPNPPFEGNKDKKNEFPDAFMIARIKQFVEANGEVCLVSNDYSAFKHLEHTPGIKLFRDIHSFLLFVNPNEDWNERVRNYLCQNTEEVTQLINDGIEDMNPFIEGRDFGRKGDFDGVEYDETIIKKIRDVSFEFVSVDSANNGVSHATISCKATIEAECVYFDESNSVWDSEEKDYLYRSYGVVEEVHMAEFEGILKLNIAEDTVCGLDGIEFELDLDQYTRQSQNFLSDEEVEILRQERRQSAESDAISETMDTLEDYHRG